MSTSDYMDICAQLSRERAELMRQVEEMRTALKIIYTWSTVDGCLVPGHVEKLIEKTLKIKKRING